MIDNTTCHSNHARVHDKCPTIARVLIRFGKLLSGELLACHVFFLIVALSIKELIIYSAIFRMNHFLLEELTFLTF